MLDRVGVLWLVEVTGVFDGLRVLADFALVTSSAVVVILRLRCDLVRTVEGGEKANCGGESSRTNFGRSKRVFFELGVVVEVFFFKLDFGRVGLPLLLVAGGDNMKVGSLSGLSISML